MTFQAILDAIGMSAESLVVLMAGLTAAASSAAVWATLLHRDPAARRARVLAAQREALRSGVLSGVSEPTLQKVLHDTAADLYGVG